MSQQTTIANLLPHDGIANYYGRIMSPAKAAMHLNNLLHQIDWKNDEAIMFGKRIVTKRKVAWYANGNYPYTYSKITRNALVWTKELLQLKQLVEKISGETFNSCLLNLYHNGDEGMGWHSDDEKTLSPGAAIASLSFGADRTFSFRHKKTRESVSIVLESGSLLIMKGSVQTNWQHALLKSKKITEPRINLTFRTMN